MRSICDDLIKAQMYEKALEILNKMKDISENILFEYPMVSAILREQAQLFDLINSESRLFATYFKVGFFGTPVPELLRNKEFIFRGNKCDRRDAILDQLHSHFPQAVNYNYSDYPDETIRTGDKVTL